MHRNCAIKPTVTPPSAVRRRRKAKTPDSPLRRLALAGHWDEVRELLAERLSRDPHDAEARSEMERLNRGEPLRAAESARTRKRREEQEMAEELAAELALYRNARGLPAEWKPALIAKRHRRLATIRSTLGKRLPEPLRRDLEDYFCALSARVAAQRRQRRRRLALAIGLPLVLAAATAGAQTLRHHAKEAQEALATALNSENPARVEQAMAAADSIPLRLASMELRELIHKARLWTSLARRRQEEFEALLARLETGQGRISTLPLAQRAEAERCLRALPPSMTELHERWQRLCDKEARALAAQREEILRRFRAPLPPLPELSGNLVSDDALLQQQQQQLSEREQEWRDARELFGADDTPARPLQERLAELRLLREDIAALRRSLDLLPTARSYAQYRKILGRLTPKRYAPALRMMDIRNSLPSEDKLRDRMQDHGRQLPPGMMEAARHALLDGGPSFTAAFSANARQLQYMEDVFTAKVLQKVLYEMSAPSLPSVIVEERPVPEEDSVSFSPSPLDPTYTLDTPRRITWHNPQGVFIRRIDTTTLLPQTGITRERFFSRGNLPALLDALLRFEHRECPALARAYVFRRLLEVMAAHEWPTMFGIAYAPTMRADARSFAELMRSLPFPLEAGCWLRSTPETRRAEEAFARWFHERRHRHYAEEIARNFGALVQVHPRYIGFINAEGKAELFRQLPAETLLWYISDEGLTTTPPGEALESPALYSPVFIVAKD